MVLAHTAHWLADLVLVAPVVVVLGWVLIANYRGRRREKRSGEGESGTEGATGRAKGRTR